MSWGNVSKYEFLTGEDVLPEKGLLEKAATIKRFEYSPLGKELKKQTDIAKDQDKLFKDHINVNNSSGEDGVRAEDDEIIGDVDDSYIDHKYKDLINKFNNELKENDLHLMGIDNQIMNLKILSLDI